ncbi:MAG: hypothetical protein LQ338_007088 [Usnochroma carphineum]|nr:MAG: hypothetical protein LQ338_007088 [Usnochroma carphineum]
MPVLAKIKGAVAFMKAVRNEGKDDHPQRPLIRHQNPRLNGPGVAPAPPLRPPPIDLTPVSNDSDPKAASGDAIRLTKRSRLGYRSIKKSPQRGKFLLGLHRRTAPAGKAARSDHRTPKPEEEKRSANLPEKSIQEPKSKTEAQHLTTHRSTCTLRVSGSGTSHLQNSRTQSLPRLPHQRMHFITSIGSGGEGRCDLFRLHNPPKNLVAVKTLKGNPELIWHRNTKHKPREVYILQDLLPPHERIIRLYDYTRNPLTTKLYIEYCPLGDLEDIIDNYFNRDVRIPEGFIWHAFLQLAEAMHHLHTAARDETGKHVTILHRDIKPANIFLRPSSSSSCPQSPKYPDLVLADFGCSTHLAPKPNPTSCIGSIVYQGPETPLQNSASDMWSLGCTMHALVHGYPAMCKQPEGMRYQGWEWDPLSRVVEDVRGRGYSRALQTCVRGVMRLRWRMRWAAGEAVEQVRRERKDWGGVDEGLEEWAFGGRGKRKEKMVQRWEEGRV